MLEILSGHGAAATLDGSGRSRFRFCQCLFIAATVRSQQVGNLVVVNTVK
jgi:hypothetical protein